MEAVVVYLLYGDRREYQRELAFSALSALRYLREDSRGVRLCVLTDRPRLQFDLGLSRIEVGAQELATWTHGGRCNHRAKPLALQRALETLGCPVALVDTDTCFVQHPAKLFERIGPGASVMHAYEYALGESPLWQPLLAKLDGSGEVAGYPIEPRASMYNSGVIGMHPDDGALLSEAVELLDALDRLEPIFNAEQFAIGTVLSRKTQLSSAHDVLRHYWGVERGFVHLRIARLLRGFHPERVPELAHAAAATEVGVPAKRFRHRLWSRIRARLSGWDRDCRFGYLAYLSALSTARSDVEVANAWLAASLGALESSNDRARTAARRRSALRSAFGSLDPRSGWIDPTLALRWRRFWAT